MQSWSIKTFESIKKSAGSVGSIHICWHRSLKKNLRLYKNIRVASIQPIRYARGMNILNLLKAENLERADNQANYRGAVLRLGKQFGAKRLGFHVEVIDPKNFSCPYHYHTDEEELFLVLEGEAIVRRDNEFRKVGPGDLIFYEVGATTAHNMYNHTDKPFKFLALSNNSEKDTCHYPDSHKVSSEMGYMQDGVAVNYFKDEEDPAQYWPAHALRGEVPSQTE